MIGMPADQKKTMRMTMIASPVMILFFTISTCWLRSLLLHRWDFRLSCPTPLIINLYRPRIRREIEAGMKESTKVVKPRPEVAAETTSTTSAKSTVQPSTVSRHRNRNRNAGKQRHH